MPKLDSHITTLVFIKHITQPSCVDVEHKHCTLTPIYSLLLIIARNVASHGLRRGRHLAPEFTNILKI